MSGVAFNGKFLTAAPTGVHRVAGELIRAADRLRCEGIAGRDPWRLLTPRRRTIPLRLDSIATEQVGWMSWQPWEQIELPLIARRDLLVSLCNLAPLAHPRQLVMMHDAQVFASPQSYSAKFRAWYRFAQPRLGCRAEVVLTVSEFSKSQLLHYGVVQDDDKIVVIPNGVDHLIRSTPSMSTRRRERPFVLALANTQAHKNVSVLLQAFEDPRLSEMDLVLVGKADRGAFQAAGLAAPPNVVFAGMVSDEELSDLYKQAICLAFPSKTEGFGLPPLEAMTAGCPALVAPCGALPEVCAAAALYADADDVEGWRSGILHLANDEEARRLLVALGHLQASRFTWKASAEKLLATVAALS